MKHYSNFDFVNFEKLYKNDKHYDRISKKYYSDGIYTFDIETSTAFFINNKWTEFDYSIKDKKFYKTVPKISWCYIWQFSIDYQVYYGRNLEEFKEFFDKLLAVMQKHDINIFVWVHNLAYEFQYLRNIFEWKNVFARKKLKPMKCDYRNSTFRCSYFLSRLSLATISEKLNRKYKKAIGFLNYDKIRFSDTELTDNEMIYCEFDCLSLSEYIEIMESQYGHLVDIPLTQTSKVRRLIKSVYKGDWEKINKCRNLVPNLEEYLLLKESFLGGLTYANPTWVGRYLSNIHSKDETSCYPFAMVTELYPSSHFSLCKNKEIDKKEGYLTIYRLRFKNIQSKSWLKYLSYSRLTNVSNDYVCSNGRLVKASEIEVTLTDLDLETLQKVYSYSDVEVVEKWRATSAPLDQKYINLILQLFNDKNTLKNVEGMEQIYMEQKEELNSLYGVFVTNNVCPQIVFVDDWEECYFDESVAIEQLEKLKRSYSNFQIYSQGVYVTAYARKYLVDTALQIGDDVVYMDTDSIKYIDITGEHEKIFEKRNMFVDEHKKEVLTLEEYKKSCHKYGNLGEFSDEGIYKEFVTYGSKKYGFVKEKNGKDEISLVVSGLGKKAKNSIKSLEEFKLGKVFYYDDSGRMTMEYCNNQPKVNIDGHIIDYRFGICAYKSTYTLGLDKDFEQYLESCDECEDTELLDWMNDRKRFYKYCNEMKKKKGAK